MAKGFVGKMEQIYATTGAESVSNVVAQYRELILDE
jgi:hypothetical protein